MRCTCTVHSENSDENQLKYYILSFLHLLELIILIVFLFLL
jgi:hypothetical protein